jgi:hypothetical protein
MIKREEKTKKGQRTGVCGGAITTSSNPPKKPTLPELTTSKGQIKKKIQLSETLGPATQ